MLVLELKPKGPVIPGAALSRAESAVPRSTKSRFLADKPGFGMTRVEVFAAKLRHRKEQLFSGHSGHLYGP
jgi:hypothetical protein